MAIETIPPGADWGDKLRSLAAAMLRAESWLPTRNAFVTFGLCWGLPVPLATLVVECVARDLPLTPAGLGTTLAENPWQWLFMLHPLLFAGVFGSIGTVANDRARELQRVVEQLRNLADTDGLTGLLNHRAFQSRIRSEAARAEREQHPITLLMIDIDHFKHLNDTHGHQAGDEVLCELARRMLAVVRPYDVVARYGGEEFTVILPGLDAREATQAAERIRLAVASQPFRFDGTTEGVTISIGLAMRHEGEGIVDWIAAADERLYASKDQGRNRTTPPPPPPVADAG